MLVVDVDMTINVVHLAEHTVYVPSRDFPSAFVSVHVAHPYSRIVSTAALKYRSFRDFGNSLF